MVRKAGSSYALPKICKPRLFIGVACRPEPPDSLRIMLRKVASVGGLTLVSRVLGFIRDMLTAFVLGAGPVADAFFVAFRLP